MSDPLFGNVKPERGNSKINKRILYCAICDTRLSPGEVFCPKCDPPLPPGEEPEEIGISFSQALLRIGILVALFVVVAFGRLDISFDRLFLGKQIKGEMEILAENEKPQDKDFQTVHTIVVPLANIRSKPSINGKIILIAKFILNILVDFF